MASRFTVTFLFAVFPVLHFSAQIQLPSSLSPPVGHFSEFVTIPRQPNPEPNGWIQTNCPHKQSGLVNWHDPTAWPSGAVPLATEMTITIPSDVKMIIRGCSLTTDIYNTIVVPVTSSLIFDDVNVTLNVREIRVQGDFQIGSETCRLYNHVNIMFHGSRSSSSLSSGNTTFPSKGLVATSGTVDVHGKLYFPTWTRLSRTISEGSNLVFVQDSVNWEIGQEILLTTTVWRDYPDDYLSEPGVRGKSDMERKYVKHQNEVFQIVDIGHVPNEGPNRVLQLNGTVLYQHYAGVEYQGEVVLLSRRIRFYGSQSGDKFGGHTQIAGSAIGRFSGVEARYMGQQNVLARYPFHFHLLGECPLCFIQDCSVRDSHFRCYTIHGTNATRVERNTAFNVRGHCLYLEDGVEERNDILFNMHAFVSPILRGGVGRCQDGEIVRASADLLIPADVAASGFYISNAYNRVRGNAASGGWSGFAYVNLPKAIGSYRPSRFNYNDYNWWDPMNRPVLEFDGNTAHSSGFYWDSCGGCIYTGGELKYSGNVLRYKTGRQHRLTKFPNGTEAWMKWTNVKAFLCQRGINHWGDRLELNGYESHDNRRSLVVFGESHAKYVLVNAWSGNHVGNAQVGTHEGFQYYDSWAKILLDDWTFRNFNASDYAMVMYKTHSEKALQQGINAARNIKYDNCDYNKILLSEYCGTGCKYEERMSGRIANVYDYDGSLTLRGRPTIAGSHRDWWNVGPDCVKELAWNLWLCDWTSDRKVAYIDLHSDGNVFVGASSPTTVGIVGSVSQFGSIGSQRSIELGLWSGACGMSNMGWFYKFNEGTPKTIAIKKIQIPRNHFLVVALKYPPGSTIVSASLTFRSTVPPKLPIPTASTLAEVFDANETLVPWMEFTCPRVNWWSYCQVNSTGGRGPLIHFDSTGWLYLRVVNLAFYNHDQYQRPRVFERDGMKLWDVNLYYGYEIVVECANGTSVDGTYCTGPSANEYPPQFPHQSYAWGPGHTPYPTHAPLMPTTRPVYPNIPSVAVPPPITRNLQMAFDFNLDVPNGETIVSRLVEETVRQIFHVHPRDSVTATVRQMEMSTTAVTVSVSIATNRSELLSEYTALIDKPNFISVFGPKFECHFQTLSSISTIVRVSPVARHDSGNQSASDPADDSTRTTSNFVFVFVLPFLFCLLA